MFFFIMALSKYKIKYWAFYDFFKIYACAYRVNAAKIIYLYTEPTPNEFKLIEWVIEE
jgi:hypothetical protein